MKSLAHPSWPYVGTPHEWRGFKTMPPAATADAEQVSPARGHHFPKAWPDFSVDESRYQHLNFGPDLT